MVLLSRLPPKHQDISTINPKQESWFRTLEELSWYGCLPIFSYNDFRCNVKSFLPWNVALHRLSGSYCESANEDEYEDKDKDKSEEDYEYKDKDKNEEDKDDCERPFKKRKLTESCAKQREDNPFSKELKGDTQTDTEASGQSQPNSASKGTEARHAPKENAEKIEMQDPERQARRNAQERNAERKRMEDPEYRSRRNALKRNAERKRMEDPEYRSRRNAGKRVAERKRMEDPEYRARRNDKKKTAVRKRMARRNAQKIQRMEDPEY